MNHRPYLDFSPLEPTYYRHYRKCENGWTAWAVENEATGEIVASGLAETVPAARVEMDRAVDEDLKRISRDFDLQGHADI